MECRREMEKIQKQMLEEVTGALERGKRGILVGCEERVGELLGLAGQGGA
jgi:hypothetical protein